MITYFETSAIMKLVVLEEGAERAGSLWDASDRVITTRLAYAEARAALAAAHRATRLSKIALGRGKLALESRFQEIYLIEVTEEVVRSAGDLAEEFGLRGYDAVHLASALALDAPGLVIVTWDRELAQASHQAGLDLAGIRID